MAKRQGRLKSGIAYSPIKLAANVADPAGNNQTKAQVDTFEALIAPRNMDRLMFFNHFGSNPALPAAYTKLSEDTGINEIILAWKPDPAGGTFYEQLIGGSHVANIEAQLALMKALDKPILFRIGHEFNGNWQTTWGSWHESVAEFKPAFQKMYELIHAAGGKFTVAFNPNTYRVGSSSQMDWEPYFPGAAYVDAVGHDSYMKGGELARQPATMIKSEAERMKASAPGVPYYIFETGCCPSGEDKDGELVKSVWFANLATLVNSEIAPVAGVGYWHRHKEGESDNTIDSSGTDIPAREAFKAMVNNPRFV
jgi:Glycosyl hydrolase family 26